MRWIVLVSVVALAVSCKRDESVRFDMVAVKLQVQQRMERAMRQPSVTTALDQLIAAVGADPQLRERGTALLASLAADPTIAKSVQQLLGAAQQSPELQRAVRQLMKANPGLSAGEIGAMVGKRAETNWSSSGITDRWMRAWNRFLPKLKVGAVPAIFDTAIGVRFNAYVDSSSERWSRRIIELNGGSLASPERAAELYVDSAWSEPRLERFVLASLKSSRLQTECIAALRRMLDLVTVRDALREAAATVAGDATVRDAAGAVIVQLTDETPVVAVVGGELERLLQAPPVAPAVNKLLARVLGDPEVPKIIVDAFDHLRSDPQLGNAVDQLLDHW